MEIRNEAEFKIKSFLNEKKRTMKFLFKTY